MSFLDKIFGTKIEEKIPDVVFGRYSDAFKEEKKYDAWDKALSLFDEGKFQESYEAFFDYLLDEKQENLEFSSANDRIEFHLLQGSKKVKGTVDEQIVKVEAKVAKIGEWSIGMMRRMLELNFSLKYSRFSIDDENNLTLLFDSYLLDGSPYKLYYALKEIAVNADKQDDLLLGEFADLQPINTGHLKEIDENEKRIKFDFLQKRIKAVLEEVDSGKLNQDQYPGGIGYLLLDLAYRLDYLIKPEGNLMEAFERIHRLFFAPDGKSPVEKNLSMRKAFEEILKKEREEFYREIYVASSSFGITSPSNMQQLTNFVNSELPNMDWYVSNKHEKVALAVTGYIVGYSTFNFAFQPPVKELITLYYRITEPQFFKDLGFEPDYFLMDNNELNKRAIEYKLDEIEERHKKKYPKLKINAGDLDMNNLVSFAKSYLKMMGGLDLEKPDKNG